MSDTIAAISTGTQVSGIGIVRMSGDKSIEICDKLFSPISGKQMSAYKDRQLVYGELKDVDGKVMDICMCTISHGPHSYTGEDTAEFQCHGSPAVLRQTLEAIFKNGARQAGPGEFTKRAFINGRMGLTQAEAVIDVIDAESIEIAKNAVGQLGGAIQNKADQIYNSLTEMCAHYHAVLDYPDEDIEDFEMDNYKEIIDDAIMQLDRLLVTFSRGKLMNEGIPTAIAGRPNAGKSSLLNAILGYERAIVTNIPGTTRDTIEEKAKIGKLTLRLIDTAGVNSSTDDVVERLGVERSLEAINRAELVLVVVDGSEQVTGEDLSIIEKASENSKCIVVFSKSDKENFSIKEINGVNSVGISSKTGEGIEKLENTIEKLFPIPDVPTGEILTNARQADSISRTLDSMRSARNAMEIGFTPDAILTEVEDSMKIIGELTGRNVGEDITTRIFSRFCVGK